MATTRDSNGDRLAVSIRAALGMMYAQGLCETQEAMHACYEALVAICSKDGYVYADDVDSMIASHR